MVLMLIKKRLVKAMHKSDLLVLFWTKKEDVKQKNYSHEFFSIYRLQAKLTFAFR